MSIRTIMLHSAIAAAREANEVLDVATIAKRLPADFDLRDDQELADAIAATAPAEPEPTVVEPEPTVVQDADEADLADVVHEEPQLTRDECVQMIARLEDRLHQVRAVHNEAIRKVKIERDLMSKAILIWQTDGQQPMTHTELVKSAIKGWQAEKQAIADGVAQPRPERRPGKSYLDRMLAAQAGGNAADHVRGQLRRGHRRGAYPATMRGATVPKPPSVR